MRHACVFRPRPRHLFEHSTCRGITRVTQAHGLYWRLCTRGESAIETSEGINDDAVKGATNPHRRERVKLCDRAALTKSQI